MFETGDELFKPAYNHSRGDSEATPCDFCKSLRTMKARIGSQFQRFEYLLSKTTASQNVGSVAEILKGLVVLMAQLSTPIVESSLPTLPFDVYPPIRGFRPSIIPPETTFAKLIEMAKDDYDIQAEKLKAMLRDRYTYRYTILMSQIDEWREKANRCLEALRNTPEWDLRGQERCMADYQSWVDKIESALRTYRKEHGL